MSQLLLSLFCIISTWFSSCSDNDKVTIEISQEHRSLMFEAPESRQTIQISANGDWNVKVPEDAPWCTASHEIGTGEQYINIYVDVNNTNTDRSTRVIVSGKGAEEIVINVIQHKNKLPEYTEAIAPDASGMNIEMTAMELSKMVKVGFNVGNTYDAVLNYGGVLSGDETSWGNPTPNADLFRGIKAAGFNFVRMPVTVCHQLVDPDGYEIKKEWLDKIAKSVDAAIDAGLYIMINIHHEGHWLNHLTDKEKDAVYEKFEAIWKQIALRFRNYNDHLLFAGMNEIQDEEKKEKPTAENFRIHNGLHQLFINTVRATGGRNHYRHLVVQSYNTGISHALSGLKFPSDVVENRMFLEAHFYDPWEFCLKEDDYKTVWGRPFANAGYDVPSWGLEEDTEETLKSLKTFIDRNIPVMIGEWGAIARVRGELEGKALEVHIDSRDYYYWHIVKCCLKYGLLPVNWDIGLMFKRLTGEQSEVSNIAAIMKAVAGEEYVFTTIQLNK